MDPTGCAARSMPGKGRMPSSGTGRETRMRSAPCGSLTCCIEIGLTVALLCLLRSATCGADLVGVLVRVRSVDAQPGVEAEAPDFRVRALAQPVGLIKAAHQLRRRGAGGAEQLERGFVSALVVQAVGEAVLVVTLDRRPILGDQQAEAHRRRHLAVAKMMDDLPRRPLAR